jgi:hypothetical protein
MSIKRTDNHGSLSRNKKKEKETHPTHKGSCIILGHQFWISAYVNESRDSGEKYFKLYFEPKKPREDSTAEPHSASLPESPDIPF